MDRVVLDASLREKFGDYTNPFHIYDEAGHVVLYVTPANHKSLYEGIDSGASPEELRRRISEGGGRSLKEIMADLEAGRGRAAH
jgi:hypothetical protein